MLWQLLTGAFPFWEDVRAASLQQVWRAVLADPIDFRAPALKNCSPAARDLLKRMLVRDPDRRISASGALAHPFLREPGDAASPLPLRASVVQRLQVCFEGVVWGWLVVGVPVLFLLLRFHALPDACRPLTHLSKPPPN